jgi:hypothetical protein
VDDAFGHWFAGFTDGEGSFIIMRQRTAAGAEKFNCFFALALRCDDGAVLQEIRDELGFGRINRFNKPGAQQQDVLRVAAKADCLRLVGVFDRYPLRAKKARDYAIWREAVVEWQRIRRVASGHVADWSRMATLKARLEAGRRFNADEVGVPESAPVTQLRMAE